ncbi:MAG: hypothetical protein ABIT83_17595 [Massilia sp.]
MVPLIPIAMQLAQFAPGIIKLLTGSDRAADVAGQVVGIAQTVTGADSAQAAVSAIQTDPAKAMEFQLAVGAQQMDLERIYLVDVQNARAMQVAALAQEDLFSKRFVYYFAAAWSLFSMIYFLSVTFWPPPPEGVRIADTILGVLIASVIGVMFAYFYGTTKANKTKDDTINKLTR